LNIRLSIKDLEAIQNRALSGDVCLARLAQWRCRAVEAEPSKSKTSSECDSKSWG